MSSVASPIIDIAAINWLNQDALSGTADANSTVAVYDGTTELGTATANASGVWSFTTATLAPGAHAFTATDTDAAGNTSNASSALTVTVPNTPLPPATVNSFSPDSGTVGDGITNANQLTLSGTAAPNSAVQVFDGPTWLGTTSANGSGAWTFATATLATGSHSFTATDASANSNVALLSSSVDTHGLFAGVPTVTQTPGAYYLATDLIVTNENLVVAGCTFTGPGQIILSGTASLTGSGTLSNGTDGAVLIQDSGSYLIQGLNFQNSAALAGVLVEPVVGTTEISSLNITGNTFANGNFGILRNGGLGQIDSTTITNNVIYNMQGDGIELNVVPNDRNIVIANNNISQINNTNSQPNWGIGIGIAGAAYTNSFSNGQVAQDFVIEGNIISGAVQGIHVEQGKNFTIQNNTVSGISNSYSPNSGLESSGIVTYGSEQFTIVGNTVYRQDSGLGIFINPGVISAQYVGLPTNFTVSGNTLNALSTLSGYVWATTGTVNITNNTGGSINVPSSPSGMTLTNNVSSGSTALNVTLDTVAPSAPVISSDSPASGTALTLSGTAAANSTVTVFDGTTKLGMATVNASGAWSYTTGTLANGAHSFTATDTDAAGNTSTASAALAVTVATVAPSAPAIASFSPDSGVVGDGITNATNLTLIGAAAANSTVTVFDGTTKLGTASVNASGTWSYATGTLANGAHSFTASDTAAGNTGAASSALSVTIDTTAPVAPAIASFSTDSGTLGDHITNDNTLTLSGTAEANSTVKIYDGATPLGSATANGSGAWSYTTAALNNGAHSLTATVSDAAGNTGAASPALAVTVDTVAPIAPVIASDTIVNTNETMLTGTAEAGNTVTIFDGTTQLGTATADGSGAWSYTTSPLSNGDHAFTTTATDAAGNTSLASQPIDPTISNIGVTINGTSGADTIDATHGINGVFPTSGDDTINGGAGNDTISGLGGNDTINGGTGADTMIGGTGNDTYIVDNTGDRVIENPNEGTDTILSSVSSTLPANVENLTLTGTAKINGTGNGLDNVISGNNGNNILTGLGGNDTLTGGGKSDTFVFGSNFGKDIITDFKATGPSHDVLQFNHNTFNNFAAVLAHAAQVGSDVVITVDAADTVTLHNVHLSSLQKNDIHIV